MYVSFSNAAKFGSAVDFTVHAAFNGANDIIAADDVVNHDAWCNHGHVIRLNDDDFWHANVNWIDVVNVNWNDVDNDNWNDVVNDRWKDVVIDPDFVDVVRRNVYVQRNDAW